MLDVIPHLSFPVIVLPSFILSSSNKNTRIKGDKRFVFTFNDLQSGFITNTGGKRAWVIVSIKYGFFNVVVTVLILCMLELSLHLRFILL